MAQARPEPGPQARSLSEARKLAASCTRCPLYRDATQTVFGEGGTAARLMLVGEQPGDKEDVAGKPFVGPAGALLDKALAEAGVPRGETYVTNAVKHFKFTPRGKRRIHKKPDTGEIEACHWWLDLELELVDPQVVVAMGTTALRSVLGRSASITSLRGKPVALGGDRSLVATVHPSYLLRLQAHGGAGQEFTRFVGDLSEAWRAATT
jgi:uracil-DNA glycosylase